MNKFNGHVRDNDTLLRYVYLLPNARGENKPKVGSCISDRLLDRLRENKLLFDVSCWVILFATYTTREGIEQYEKEYQIKYDCFDFIKTECQKKSTSKSIKEKHKDAEWREYWYQRNLETTKRGEECSYYNSGAPVLQFDKQGNFIREYANVNRAAEDLVGKDSPLLKSKAVTIRQNVRGKIKSTNGFIYKRKGSNESN